MEIFDTVILKGRVIDGTGNPWFRADVGVKGGKIVKIGNLCLVDAMATVDANGLVVCPGFIDIHSHSELELLINPRAESKIRQGVTTEVNGNCAASAAPVTANSRDLVKRRWFGLLGDEVTWDWFTMGDYLNRLERQGIALNVAQLVGHGTLRVAVMWYEKGPPTKKELKEMKVLLAKSMEEGAWGMSAGLYYTPSGWADTDELIELCKVVAEHGGYYAPHIRSEGDRLVEAVKESIEIGEKAHVPVQIAHHKAVGIGNWGKVKETLKMIDETREKGIDVSCDRYPYLAGYGSLGSALPRWAFEGGIEKLMERLRDPKTREKIRRDMEGGMPGEESIVKQIGWGKLIIAFVKSQKNKNLQGKTVAEIAESRGVDPYDVAFDLMIEENGFPYIIEFCADEEDVRMVMQHPASMIATDGWAYAPYGVLGKSKTHPRCYGTFPRVLGRYVREEKVLRLEDAIRKMTSYPAQRVGLRDRGLIREGNWADIVVFDPERIIDMATYTEGHQYPVGIKYVMVNGELVIKEGEHTGKLPGKVLRRH